MSIISTLPYTLTNGSTADATQVMANFNQIVNNVNANAAANGANSDITSLTGLSTPLAASEGGTGQTTALIPSGTVMLFQQATAPTSWTKIVTNNDAALRVVSGTPGTGGSVAFSTAFSAANTVDGHSVTQAELPNCTFTVTDPGHTHTYVTGTTPIGGAAGSDLRNGWTTINTGSSATGISVASGGSGTAHSHTLTNLAVKYVDVLAASKN